MDRIGTIILVTVMLIGGLAGYSAFDLANERPGSPQLKKVGNITTIKNGRGAGTVDLWEYKHNRNDCMVMISVINGMPSQATMECK